MMPRFKKTVLALLLLAMLLVLTSCGGPEATYKSANNLLAKGKYAEAAEKFASLGSYEDAAYLAIYADACVKGESDDPYEINEAVIIFNDLSGFKDSDMRATYYWGRFWENRGRYFEAANAGDGFQFMEQALECYESIRLFLDCPTRIKTLEKDIPIAKDNTYSSAIKKAESGNYDEADELFSKLGDYKDSENRIAYYELRETEDALAISTDHDALLALAVKWDDAGEYLDCSKRAEALTKRASAIIDDKYQIAANLMGAGKYEEAITAFIEIQAHKDSAEQIKACETAILDGKYDAAMALKEAGKYTDAYEAFVALNGHKDSKGQVDAILSSHPNVQYQAAKVGDYVTFGTYEQDNNTSNGKEAIEWLVLAKENNRILVISRYALYRNPYNAEFTSVTWETCTLRKWLNNDFLKAAFSTTEQAIIPTVTVSADENPDFSTRPGNATQDKVFLLSIPEANKYFTSDNVRQCKPTAYAKEQRAHTNSNGFCWWWLRSPGNNLYYAAVVDYDGGVDEYGNCVGENQRQYGHSVNYDNGAVRPALWINPEP